MRVGAERVGPEGQRDLVGLAVAVRVLRLEGLEGRVVLLDGRRHRQPEGVEPGGVDVQEVRVLQDPELFDRGEGVDVPLGVGERRPDVGTFLEDRRERRGVLLDEVFEGQQRPVAAVLDDLGVAQTRVVEDVGQAVACEHEVLLLGVDLLGEVGPVDRDVGVLLPLLNELHVAVVGGEGGLRPAEGQRDLRVDDRQPLEVEADVGRLVVDGSATPSSAGGQQQRPGDGERGDCGETAVSHEGLPVGSAHQGEHGRVSSSQRRAGRPW